MNIFWLSARKCSSTIHFYWTSTLQWSFSGFVNATGLDFVPNNSSQLYGVGGSLSSSITSNLLGGDFTPNQQFHFPVGTVPRTIYGLGSDLGAFSAGTNGRFLETTTSSATGGSSTSSSTGKASEASNHKVNLLAVLALLLAVIL